MRVLAIVVMLVGALASKQVQAQSDETLADIRQQLSVLYVEMQRLKRELSTTGSPQGAVMDGSVLNRVTAMEEEIVRLTRKTEQLEFRVERIVTDGTNRIGDLEFRLVELEGGDVSQLGETTTLGGDTGMTLPVGLPPAGGETAELAVGEEADFNAAKALLDNGDAAGAAEQFAQFAQNYPGSPLMSEVNLRRGQALEKTGSTTDAARAYLEAYSSAPTGPVADQALFHLGASLGRLGQVNEACVTLNEVENRHPGSDMVAPARAQMQTLGCP